MPKIQQLDLIDSILTEPNEALIVSLIKSGVRSGEEILKQSKLSASEYNQAMTMLEINSHIQALGANRWSLK